MLGGVDEAEAAPNGGGPLVRQAWWDGDETLPASKVVEALTAMGECHDSNQAGTTEEEQASWCTTLYAKCSKTKARRTSRSLAAHNPRLSCSPDSLPTRHRLALKAADDCPSR